MADITKRVRDLRVQITEDNQKVITAVIQFTTGPGDAPDNYTITIPRLIQRRIDRLLREFMKTISDADDIVRDTVVDKDYTIRLQS